MTHQRTSKRFGEWEVKFQALPEAQHLSNPDRNITQRSLPKFSTVFWDMLFNFHVNFNCPVQWLFELHSECSEN